MTVYGQGVRSAAADIDLGRLGRDTRLPASRNPVLRREKWREARFAPSDGSPA